MFPKIRFVFALSTISVCGLFCSGPLFSQTGISFDVPAIARASVMSVDAITDEKTVEITLPISVASEAAYRGSIHECQFDVRWNQQAFAIEDFEPRSETESAIEGLINVERDRTRNATLSLNLAGTPLELSSARLASDLGWGNSRHETFRQRPRRQILVASGTIDRATGAFFRFHPSPTKALEGSRELRLTYRVPGNWTTGILKVECRASGANEIAGLWKEPFEVDRSFVVPVFEDKNVAAQQLAIDFASAEQELRRTWVNVEKQMKKVNPLLQMVSKRGKLSDQWPHELIQSGDDQYFSEFRGYLTKEVAVAAETFVKARQRLSSELR